MNGEHEQPFFKHRVRSPHTKHRSEHLRKDVRRNVLPPEPPL